MTLVRFVLRLAAATAATTFLAAVPAMAAAQESVAAVWVPREVRFVYQGFTTYYACDAMRDRIRKMLAKLGAQDLKVQSYGCLRPSGPTLFPGVRVNMRVLVPASSADAAKEKNPGSPVQAHWQEVVLMPANASLSEQGNCELIEQFKETFLPLFSTRNIRYASNCVPRQVTMGTHLSAEVLLPPPSSPSG